MSAPQGIAIEQVTGDVYVTDQGNRRVDEFTEAGVFVRAFGLNVGGAGVDVCTTSCEAGTLGAGAGEFGATIGYPAVDHTTGDVYVADPANRRVQVFEADGVFKQAFGWGVASGTGEFQVCTSTCQAGVANASEPDLGGFAAGSPSGVAVDASGDVYVVDGGAPDFRVEKFAAVSEGNVPLAEFFAPAQLTGSSSATAPSDVAVEPELGGNVLVAREPASPAEHLVYELGSAGALIGTYAEGAALPAPQGLAAGSSTASVYFSTSSGDRVFVLGTLVPPSVTVEAATGATASEATLHGTVNPNETPPNGIETGWQFEYSTNNTEWTPLGGGKLTASTSPVAVTQTITGLEGSTLYYVRLHASKEFAAGSATSATVQFTTGATPPTVSGEAVSDVAATSATFSAQVNPQHLDTTYHFEYDTAPYTSSAEHGTRLPEPDADIGAGVSAITVSQHSQDLEPHTTYHYRLVATNSVETTDGAEGTFTTQTTGGALVLPDGRQWEMVSPPNKGGAQIAALGTSAQGDVEQAAADGSAFTWDANTAISSEAEGNLSFETSQVYSARGVDGWSSRDIAPPHEESTGVTVGSGTEYKFFSSDLSLGLVQEKGAMPLSPLATEKTLYLRDDAGSSYLPLVTPTNVMTGNKFDGPNKGSALEIAGQETSGETPIFRGASPDLSHVVFSDNGEALTSNAHTGQNLYAWAGGQLQLVSLLPESEGGTAAATPELGSGTFEHSIVRHAVSNDGSRVIWTGEIRGGDRPLYMRDMTKGETKGEPGETIRVDAAQGVTEPTEAAPVFQTASDDGHRVFFTDGNRLTADAAVSSTDLYVFETTNSEGESLKGTLADLTADHNVGESAGVLGVLPGISEEGSYVYLVASGVLSEAENPEHEKAVSGADNLYVLHDTGAGWTTMFIARLSSEDENDWSGRAALLEHFTSRVSPDGRYFAFMSDRELTGYDNHDAHSGVADEEVFLYHAPEHLGTESGSLVCASCDPTGVRPTGVLDEGPLFPDSEVHASLLIDEAKTWNGRWLAANVSGWTPATLGVAYYQGRYLSDGGRLFFNSSAALVPQDVNGTEDVYEFEPSRVGSCASGSSTFSGTTGGCVALISSGSSSEESVFLDASESGGDVFFLTAAKLVPQDYDTSLDVYDAHECTVEVPCVSSPVSSLKCTTTDACRAPSAPQPSIFGSPPSETFSGTGNPASAPAAVVKAKAKAKAKVLTRAQKLGKALAACKKKAKKQRPPCEKRARQRYGALKAKKTSKGRK